MELSLPPDLAAFVRHQVHSGKYRTAAEVINEALHQFREHRTPIEKIFIAFDLLLYQLKKEHEVALIIGGPNASRHLPQVTKRFIDLPRVVEDYARTRMAQGDPDPVPQSVINLLHKTYIVSWNEAEREAAKKEGSRPRDYNRHNPSLELLEAWQVFVDQGEEALKNLISPVAPDQG